jgi:hypothetical protein
MTLITTLEDERLTRIEQDNTMNIVSGIHTSYEPKSSDVELIANSLRAALQEIEDIKGFFGDVRAVAKERDAAISRADDAERKHKICAERVQLYVDRAEEAERIEVETRKDCDALRARIEVLEKAIEWAIQYLERDVFNVDEVNGLIQWIIDELRRRVKEGK